MGCEASKSPLTTKSGQGIKPNLVFVAEMTVYTGGGPLSFQGTTRASGRQQRPFHADVFTQCRPFFLTLLQLETRFGGKIT